MSTTEPPPSKVALQAGPRAPVVFFNFAPAAKTFVTNLLSLTRFQELLECEILNDVVVVGDREKEIRERIARSDLFVVFIDKTYRDDTNRTGYLDEAVRHATKRGRHGPHEIVFLCLDSGGHKWWKDDRQKRADITDWRREPSYSTWQDAYGTAPKPVNELQVEIEGLATQLGPRAQEIIACKQAAQRESCQVVIFGHPAEKAPDPIATAQQELRTELGKRGITFCSIPDAWSEREEGLPELIEAIADKVRPCLIQPADKSTADNAIDAPTSMIHKVIRVAGAKDEESKNAILACQAVLWLPAEIKHDRFRKEAEQQARGPVQNPSLQTGSAVDLSAWLARTFRIGAASSGRDAPIIFSYESIKPKDRHVFRDEIGPKAVELFDPPEMEEMTFNGSSNLDKCIKALSIHEYGIFAIHNLGSDIDEKGTLPTTLVNNIRKYDTILKEEGQQVGLSLDKIIRLGIVATTVPDQHYFRYPKKLLRDDTLSQWRYIAVAIEDEGNHVVAEHVIDLQGELSDLINRHAKRDAQGSK